MSSQGKQQRPGEGTFSYLSVLNIFKFALLYSTVPVKYSTVQY